MAELYYVTATMSSLGLLKLAVDLTEDLGRKLGTTAAPAASWLSWCAGCGRTPG